MKQKDAVLNTILAVLSFKLSLSEGRQALKPEADISEELNKLSLGINGQPEENAPPCSLDIQHDFPNATQPLYLIPDTNNFWLPNDRGFLVVPSGATIELFCSKSFANVSTEAGEVIKKIPKNTRNIRAICLQGNSFVWHGEKFEFKQFSCIQSPNYLVERTGATLGDTAASIYRVGFNITRSRYVQTLEICHDDSTLRTHYTLHRLQPANKHFQRHIKRVSFSKAGFFKQHNVNYFYTQHNQQQQVAVLRGTQDAAAAMQYFDNATLFLARGHLSAKSDQIYVNQQRTTFTFLNVAPQWQSFNGGHWAQLEDEIRKFVFNQNLDVDCYTGTWGTLQFPFSGNGPKSPFYLSYDTNNNGLLPVPQIFYRVLIDRFKPWRGIALVGVNNPHVTLSQIQEEFLLCEDISSSVPWLKWMNNTNLKKGYLYACKVEEFIHVVKHLPQSVRKVKEVLMGR